jgi:hypothetical protein
MFTGTMHDRALIDVLSAIVSVHNNPLVSALMGISTKDAALI